jgi:hypothetical protein
MRICRKCSKPVSDHSKICRDCGAILEETPDEAVPVAVAEPSTSDEQSVGEVVVAAEQSPPPDHPEFRAVSECQSVEACGISITGFTEDGDFTDRYIPPTEREDEDWVFSVEITPHPEQCFEALRRTENE